MAGGAYLACLAVPVHSTIYELAFHAHSTTDRLLLVSGSGEGTICFWESDLVGG